jgi:hypothetical protein
MINIRVLIILKHFRDLDFECYINIYVCVCERERERQFKKKKKWRLVCRERKREAIFFLKKKGDLCV